MPDKNGATIMQRYILWFSVMSGALVAGCSEASNSATEAAPSTTDDATSTGAPTTAGPTGESTETGAAPTSSGGEELGQCDPWLQDCPEGHKCMAFAPEGEGAFTGTKCTPVAANPGSLGDPCKVEDGWWSGVDDCDHGLACWDVDPADNSGQCVALCRGSEDDHGCPGSDDVCVFWVPGVAHVCLQGCDPLLQDCAEGQGCLPNWANGGQDFVCQAEYSAEEGQVFDPCEFTNACDPGLLCWGPGSALECEQDAIGCCLPFCDLKDPQCTGEGAVCTSFYEAAGSEPLPQFEDVGICVLPG
ncbi:ribulose phosphate epimerase [Nannocystis bainbridge]|uniref:Ribulose phosphate epimerase n=1 Tax=Nannocystis bainbridge TaxID=2995303 RepID=A0ABT5E341_9BACT|nr:ribulose phosphate epimerase [Nannocystis bainbridge]MDC0719177.1 ribulose phosphate epimerase [Nannocystis bainbridge]